MKLGHSYIGVRIYKIKGILALNKFFSDYEDYYDSPKYDLSLYGFPEPRRNRDYPSRDAQRESSVDYQRNHGGMK